jgi:hypothetical protein
MFGFLGGVKAITWQELYSAFIVVLMKVKHNENMFKNENIKNVILNLLEQSLKDTKKVVNEQHYLTIFHALDVYLNNKNHFDRLIEKLILAANRTDFDEYFNLIKNEFIKHSIVMAINS